MQNSRRRCNVVVQATSTGQAEAAVPKWVALSNSTSFHHEEFLKSYYDIVRFLLKSSKPIENIAKLDAEVRNLRQNFITQAEIGQNLWTKVKSYGPVYEEKSLEARFVEETTNKICMIL